MFFFNVRESADLSAKSHDVQSCPHHAPPVTCSTSCSSWKTCFAKMVGLLDYVTWLAGPGRLFRHEPQHSASACAAQLCGAPGKVAQDARKPKGPSIIVSSLSSCSVLPGGKIHTQNKTGTLPVLPHHFMVDNIVDVREELM